jgi:hypothetical protein
VSLNYVGGKKGLAPESGRFWVCLDLTTYGDRGSTLNLPLNTLHGFLSTPFNTPPPPAAREVWYRRVGDAGGVGRRKDGGKTPEILRQIGSRTKMQEGEPSERTIFWDK